MPFVFCSMLLRVASLVLIPPCCPVTAQIFLVHWGQVPLLQTAHPSQLHSHCCHHCHQPPAGGNGTLMVTASIYWGSGFFSQGSGIFSFVREPINLLPRACPFSSLLPFSCLTSEPFPAFPRCSRDKKTQLCYKPYYSSITKYASIYLAASTAHRRVLQLSHIFSLSNIKFVQVPYTKNPPGNRCKVWSTRQGTVHAPPRDKASCILLKSEECKNKLLLKCKGELGVSSQPSMNLSCAFCPGFLVLPVTYWEAPFSAKSSGNTTTEYCLAICLRDTVRC